MKKHAFRVDKEQQDRLVAELAAQLFNPSVCTRELPAEKMINAFTRTSLAGLLDYAKHCSEIDAPLDELLSPEEMQQRARELGESAYEYFQHHTQVRFHQALIELMHESLALTDASYTQRLGGSLNEVLLMCPTRQDIEHNVLRKRVVALHDLPHRAKKNFWNSTEDHPSTQFRVARMIFKDIALWTYDHQAVCSELRSMIRKRMESNGTPDDQLDEQAELWGNETAEVIWEHIGEAVQGILLVLIEWAFALRQQSAVNRYDVELDKKAAIQIRTSKEHLKQVAEKHIHSWIDQLPFEWQGSGRPLKSDRERNDERDKLLNELHEIAKTLSAKGQRLTWEALAINRKRPRGATQSGDTLRKKAKDLNVSLKDVKTGK